MFVVLTENNDILRVGLSIKKHYIHSRVGNPVYNRIKEDGWIFWIFGWWYNHAVVTHCNLSNKYSCKVNILLPTFIRWWVGWLGRVWSITCKVDSTTNCCCCRTEIAVVLDANKKHTWYLTIFPCKTSVETLLVDLGTDISWSAMEESLFILEPRWIVFLHDLFLGNILGI